MTASKTLYVAVNKAHAVSGNHKANVLGSFTRTLNAQSKIITFSGSFQITETKTTNPTGTVISPVPLFDTTGTENEDLFNAIFDNLSNPVEPAQTNFRLTGNLTSNGQRNLMFSYSGQLPYTDVESTDGLTTTRTVPPYFIADISPVAQVVVTPAEPSTVSIAGKTPWSVTASGFTANSSGSLFFQFNGVNGTATAINFDANGKYTNNGTGDSFTSFGGTGKYKIVITSAQGTFTSNELTVVS